MLSLNLCYTDRSVSLTMHAWGIIAFVLFVDQPIIFKKELGGALVKKVL